MDEEGSFEVDGARCTSGEVSIVAVGIVEETPGGVSLSPDGEECTSGEVGTVAGVEGIASIEGGTVIGMERVVFGLKTTSSSSSLSPWIRLGTDGVGIGLLTGLSSSQ